MRDYELHPEAYIDLDEIGEYIGADSPDAAKRVVTETFNAITARPLRFCRVCDYLIAYAPDERPLWVVAVIHGHSSPRVMAAILRVRE